MSPKRKSSASRCRPIKYWFNKQTSCIAGPFDEVEPGATEQLDYEAELAVVLGKAATNVATADAGAHVFG